MAMGVFSNLYHGEGYHFQIFSRNKMSKFPDAQPTQTLVAWQCQSFHHPWSNQHLKHSIRIRRQYDATCNTEHGAISNKIINWM